LGEIRTRGTRHALRRMKDRRIALAGDRTGGVRKRQALVHHDVPASVVNWECVVIPWRQYPSPSVSFRSRRIITLF
jgi:hypothetical protein